MLDIAYKHLVQHHRLRHGISKPPPLPITSSTITLRTDTKLGIFPEAVAPAVDFVVIDTGAGTYSKTLDYYLMGQFSRFVSRSATALVTMGSIDYGGGQKFEVVSFVEEDRSRMVVVQNNYANEVFLTVTFKGGICGVELCIRSH